MAKRLRVGVIGLGRRWRRYRAVLGGLRKHLAVRAVYDQVLRRAEEEARRLGCPAAAGPVDLLDREDVDAVLLLDAQWFGLWPLERACAAGKPVFCATPLAREARADDLRRQVEASQLPVLMALAPAAAPAVDGLRELLDGRLGAAHFARADRAAPSAAGLRSPAVLSLLHGCALLLGDAPVSVWAGAGDVRGFASLVLEFGAGRVAQLTLWERPLGGAGCRFQVEAERGSAAAELPRRLRWRDAEGRHARQLAGGAAEARLLEGFVEALRTGRPPRPSFEDAYRALTWWRAALRSQSEGRRVVLAPSPAEGEAAGDGRQATAAPGPPFAQGPPP
jgi:predicted dehydrogenase